MKMDRNGCLGIAILGIIFGPLIFVVFFTLFYR